MANVMVPLPSHKIFKNSLLSENYTSFCRILLATLILGAILTCQIIALSTKLKLCKTQTLEQNYPWLLIRLRSAQWAYRPPHTYMYMNFKRIAYLTIVLEF